MDLKKLRMPLTEHTTKVVAKDLRYCVQIHKSKHIAAEAWCRKHWGVRWTLTENRTGAWSCFWAGRDQPDQFTYYFVNEQDAVLFALTWT